MYVDIYMYIDKQLTVKTDAQLKPNKNNYLDVFKISFVEANFLLFVLVKIYFQKNLLYLLKHIWTFHHSLLPTMPSL